MEESGRSEPLNIGNACTREKAHTKGHAVGFEIALTVVPRRRSIVPRFYEALKAIFRAVA